MAKARNQLLKIKIIDAMLERLATPEAWCQGTAAKNAQGQPVGYSHETAVCWCMLSVWKLAADLCLAQAGGDATIDVAEGVKAQLGEASPGGVFKFNDAPERQHGDVLRVLRQVRKAILEACQG